MVVTWWWWWRGWWWRIGGGDVVEGFGVGAHLDQRLCLFRHGHGQCGHVRCYSLASVS
jgi:hypothetical protein